jgi:cell wall-associated NlpC family hydrolase
MNRRAIGPIIVGLLVMLLVAFLVVPMLLIGGESLLFAGGAGNCASTANAAQPGVSTEAANSIPATYLKWFQRVGLQYNVPWTILAGIGKVESNDGRTTLPGVTQATVSNAFGAAGPMQIGIGNASGNQWGGLPVHPASQAVNGVATDEDRDGTASVYDPADAIAGAAKYLVAHGAQQNPSAAIFAYNHASWYVQEVLQWASTYAAGGFTIADTNQTGTAGMAAAGAQSCTGNSQLASFVAPNEIVSTAVSYAEEQLGKPYLFGGTGPASFDCSGLVMMAYRAAGVNIARTSETQWTTLPRVPASKVQPGDLVFFAGSDGTVKAPGHVGLVISKNMMIEAYATGYPVRVSAFGTAQSPPGDGAVVGYAQPWPNNGSKVTASG